jgi:DNA-dependent RNA polymerase auxiliary subunit epsilon
MQTHIGVLDTASLQDTTDTDRSALYLDIQLEVDSERRVRAKLYDKRDDFNFLSVDTISQSLWFLSRFP